MPSRSCNRSPAPTPATPPATGELMAWVDEVAALTKPDRIHWIDGSAAENDVLLREMVAEGKLGRKSGKGFYDWNNGE